MTECRAPELVFIAGEPTGDLTLNRPIPSPSTREKFSRFEGFGVAPPAICGFRERPRLFAWLRVSTRDGRGHRLRACETPRRGGKNSELVYATDPRAVGPVSFRPASRFLCARAAALALTSAGLRSAVASPRLSSTPQTPGASAMLDCHAKVGIPNIRQPS